MEWEVYGIAYHFHGAGDRLKIRQGSTKGTKGHEGKKKHEEKKRAAKDTEGREEKKEAGGIPGLGGRYAGCQFREVDRRQNL
ncbi:MAG: hypothetical protein ETSY2_36580 [Candidatus Entotheonella gemina]|uniref:Uncharacterized protein n=1 Tax=Candidatus Entotheonella gemina TaxID=1429439 RepID=W4LVQ2_9BACT|nr:MAG: hypothetical protein ETSY2_36580 [Candidatus Entotheonella gemina]